MGQRLFRETICSDHGGSNRQFRASFRKALRALGLLGGLFLLGLLMPASSCRLFLTLLSRDRTQARSTPSANDRPATLWKADLAPPAGSKTIPAPTPPLLEPEVVLSLPQEAETEGVHIAMPAPLCRQATGEPGSIVPVAALLPSQSDPLIKQVIEAQSSLEILMGRAKVLLLADIPLRFQLSDDRVVEVDFPAANQLAVRARKVGTTVLSLWFDDPGQPAGTQIGCYLVRVLPDPTTARDCQALAEQINRVFPDCRITLTLSGDKVTVCGKVSDFNQAIQILRAVRAQVLNDPAQVPALPLPIDPRQTDDLHDHWMQQQLEQASGPNIINLLLVTPDRSSGAGSDTKR